MSKILICEGALVSKYSYAGREKMIKWLGNSLSSFNHEVTFCTTYDSQPASGLNYRIECIHLGMRYYTSFFKRNCSFFFLYPFRIVKILKSLRCDYVVSFGDTSFFVLLILKLFFNYQLVVSERSDPYYSSGMLDKLRRSLYRFSDKLVFQTDGAKEYFPKSIYSKSTIIPNPINIPKIMWQYNNQENAVVTVGRIDFWQKRQDLLIRSFSRVINIYPDWLLNVYGSGNDFDKLQNLIIDMNLSSNVILHGAVDNVTDELLNNKIFVLSSDFEGIPNSLLEAMSLGMPVISTDCSPGGASYLLKGYNNGYLVPANDEDKLAEALLYVIEHFDEAVERGKNARKSLERFSEQKISEMWNNVFVSL